MDFVYVTKEQMAKVDELAVRKYNIQIKQMMENAGRNVARWISNELKPKRAVCLFGKGNNGGDALCCARHLLIYGVDTKIVQSFIDGEENKEVRNQITILDRILVKPSGELPILEEGDVIVDGLIGYNLSGELQGRSAELIRWANEQKSKGVKIVSYDIPSGIHPDTGEKSNPSIEADYTITLALPKRGLREAEVGKLMLGNIGIPRELYKKEFELEIPNYFVDNDVVEIR